jgi:uncharacterized protein YabE (DUF348 family)
MVARIAAVTVAVAATAGFAVTHKTVTLTVDGQSREVSTFASSVHGVLVQEHISYTDKDVIAPGPGAPVPQTGQIVIHKARAMDLTIDGQSQTVWTTAATVEEALAVMGVRSEEALLSVARQEPIIGLAGVVTVFTKKSLSVSVDGAVKETTSNAATVGDLLKELGVVLAEGDTVEPALDAMPAAGQQIVVTRVKKPSPAPKKPSPAPPVKVDPGSAQAIAKQMMADSYGWGDDQLACLISLWNRESGWRVNASNRSSGAYGIPQALPGKKMASAGSDWQTNPATQIKWGLKYISDRYSTPCGAWSAFQSKGWY